MDNHLKEKEDVSGQCAPTVGLDAEHDYMSYEDVHDKGPWYVDIHGKLIMSDDFTHDVILRITGDFYNDEQRMAYAKNLVTKLNAPNVQIKAGGVNRPE